MKGILKTGYLIALLIFFSGCRKDQWNDCFQGTGKDKTITRILNPFSKIVIGEKFNVILTQDTSQPEQVKITAGSHIIDQITTTVNNGTLTVENKNICNFVKSYSRKITVEIRVKYLDDIEVFAAANVSSRDTLHFELRTVKVKNLGLGDVNLKINAGILDVRTFGSGNTTFEGFANILTTSIEEITVFNARNLLCDDAYIVTASPLECFVNARNMLSVDINNDGNVYYVPHPGLVIKAVVSKGDGKLIKL